MVSFSGLGLVVIDEQHKFGVAQRARLTAREPAPDVLVMTATPIPRTLTMTVYGDLDVSIIDEMPRNRGKVITAVREVSKLGEVLSFLRTQLEAGRQLYVIYPLIDESESRKSRRRRRNTSCGGNGCIPIAVNYCMAGFRRGETGYHGTISSRRDECINQHNGDRSWGRCSERDRDTGRKRGALRAGAASSASRAHRPWEAQILLHLANVGPDKRNVGKLAVLERTTNGFEVAEADWDFRGPGDLLGTAQSGLPALKIGNLKTDAGLMRRARAAATSIFKADPRLELPENQRFRRLIVEQQGRTFSNVS